MQNHGGYEGTFDEFDQTVWLTGDMEGKYPKADQYLSLVKRSDDAFAYLLDYFSHSDEPTMIVMFGDHSQVWKMSSLMKYTARQVMRCR